MALRPLHRRLLTGAVAAVLVLGIGITLLERALEPALRAPVDAYLRARTLRLARVDSAPDLTVSLPVLRLSLWRRRLALQRVGIRFERETRSGLLQFEAQAQAVRLTGLDLGDVLWRRTFRLSGVAIERPTLRWSVEGPAEVSGAQAPTDTLPVTLPANLAGNLAINARMVGAIAHLRGYPIEDPHTRTVILLTVAGSNLQAAASELGVQVGKQVAKETIRAIPIAALRRINARAAVYLVAKYGTQRSAITLAKAVPIAGGEQHPIRPLDELVEIAKDGGVLDVERAAGRAHVCGPDQVIVPRGGQREAAHDAGLALRSVGAEHRRQRLLERRADRRPGDVERL